MSFSRAQQPAWQKMLDEAWAAHLLSQGEAQVPRCKCKVRGSDCGCCRWYLQELFFATGQHSTSECNAGRDYDRAMAHFESIAGNGIKWAMKIHSGDANRLLHELRATVGGYEIDEDYLRGVARQMLQTEELPELEKLSRKQLILILGEVKRYVRRHLREVKLEELADELPEGAVIAGENEPF